MGNKNCCAAPVEGETDERIVARQDRDERVGKMAEKAAEIEEEEDPSLAQYKDPDFHNRLREDWPEDGDQLHSGGWAMTEKVQDEIEEFFKANGIDGKEARLMDLCCGEGSTGLHFAKTKGWNVVGIDISETAIQVAKKLAKDDGVENLATFVAGSAFDLPFPEPQFDVIFGQDPDAISMARRPDCFKDCMMCLKPGGLLTFHHHWIPGQGWEKEKLEEYCKESGSDFVSADMYIKDLEQAGFKIEHVEAITSLAKSHLSAQLDRMKERVAKNGGQVQPWLLKTVEYLNKGFPFGIRIHARKP